MGGDDGKEIVPEAVSKRICEHMNDDHAVSVFAMAKSKVNANGWKISDSTLTAVTESGCHIDVVLCRDVLCQRKKVVYPFEPPLATAAECRKRLVEIHHRVTRPQNWYKSGIALLSLAIVLATAWGVLVVGSEGMKEMIDSQPQIQTLAHSAQLDSQMLVHMLRGFFSVTVVGHLGMCSYVGYHSTKTLKLRLPNMLLWHSSVAFGGIFPLVEFRQMVQVCTKLKGS